MLSNPLFTSGRTNTLAEIQETRIQVDAIKAGGASEAEVPTPKRDTLYLEFKESRGQYLEKSAKTAY